MYVLLFSQEGMSFWKQSPGPHWQDAFWSSFSCSGTPIAQPIRRYRFPKQSNTDYTCLLAKPVNAPAIVDFLAEHFRVTAKTACSLPPERLAFGIETNWVVVIAIQHNQIVGTIVSRFLGTTFFSHTANKEFKQSKYKKTGYIDFFCVHPDHRKTGLGSLLLHQIDFYTNEMGRCIHFFQKELTPLFHVPPIWAGRYIYREISRHSITDSIIRKSSFQKTPANPSEELTIVFTTDEASIDTKLYTIDCGNFRLSVAITNAYHTYLNGAVGEVLYYRLISEDGESISKKAIASAIEAVIEESDYKYILMDESLPHLKQMSWVRDASYYIYTYNLNPRRFWTVRPQFWF